MKTKFDELSKELGLTLANPKKIILNPEPDIAHIKRFLKRGDLRNNDEILLLYVTSSLLGNKRYLIFTDKALTVQWTDVSGIQLHSRINWEDINTIGVKDKNLWINSHHFFPWAKDKEGLDEKIISLIKNLSGAKDSDEFANYEDIPLITTNNLSEIMGEGFFLVYFPTCDSNGNENKLAFVLSRDVYECYRLGVNIKRFKADMESCPKIFDALDVNNYIKRVPAWVFIVNGKVLDVFNGEFMKAAAFISMKVTDRMKQLSKGDDFEQMIIKSEKSRILDDGIIKWVPVIYIVGGALLGLSFMKQ